MTTYIAFTPQANDAPPFQATITMDGAQYSLTGWWNLIGRWYATIADQSGNVWWTGALVGSPDDENIYLAPGVFSASTILYRGSSGNFEISP